MEMEVNIAEYRLPKSFISFEIKSLLQDLNCQVLIENDYKKYFLSDSTYNWIEIEKEFIKNNIIVKNSSFSREYCLNCVQILHPIWKYGHEFIKISFENDKDLLYFWEFNSNSDYLKNFLKQNLDSTGVIENLLILTSVLENTLGNIYQTITKKTPPHLLRDLLETEELLNVFGKVQILFLQILIGTPNSINLRNLLWHGFPSPTEIPNYYLSVLLISIKSFSKILQQNQFGPIKIRKSISNWNEYCQRLNLEIPVDSLKDELLNHSILKVSKFIGESNLVFWQQIYKYYLDEKFSSFILLILPQIEQILRIIYGITNNLNIFAKFDEYYIIMDTIFEEKTPNGQKNCIFNIFNIGILKLIYDLFISSNGPRIRDKISHGEVNLLSIDKYTCSILLVLSFHILSESKLEFSNLDNYESKFHINEIFFKSFQNIQTNLANVKLIIIPDTLKDCLNWTPNNEYNQIKSNYFLKNIKIFFRPRNENEIIIYLIKIGNMIENSCCNLIKAFNEQFNMYRNKELRSRKRETLKNMLKNLPKLCDFLEVIFKIIKNIFFKLQTDEEFLINSIIELKKFLKQILKWIENIAKYCHSKSNEWERAEKICLEFNQVFNKEMRFFFID